MTKGAIGAVHSVVVGVVIAVCAGCSTTATGSGAGGSATPAGDSGTAGGQTCSPPKTTCEKCIRDRCLTVCAACDPDADCQQAVKDYESCIANLGPGKACTGDSQCPGSACNGGRCPVDDSPCLPQLRKNAKSADVYNCYVGGIGPCSNEDVCLNNKPL